jgi:hypothetical protein
VLLAYAPALQAAASLVQVLEVGCGVLFEGGLGLNTLPDMESALHTLGVERAAAAELLPTLNAPLCGA